MAAPSGFCQAEMTFECLASDTTIQIFLGATAITNPFTVTSTDNQTTLQTKITIATIPGNGVTITIENDSIFPLTCPLGGSHGTLHLLIQIASNIQITDTLTATDSNEGFGNISSTSFNCNLTPPVQPKKKKNKTGIFIRQNMVCVNRNYAEMISPGSCKEGGVMYVSNFRIPYKFSHVDTNGKCCFIKQI